MLKRLLLLVAALCAAPALAQTPAENAVAAETARVKVETSEGSIVLELEKSRAPITTANFLRYVDDRRLDGTTFYRAARSRNDPSRGLIQGGINHEMKRAFAAIPHEPTSRTGLRHVDATVSMARNAPGTATCDFFICASAMPYLDAHPGAKGDNLGFAAFGTVVEGLDVEKKILAGRTDGPTNVPSMKGQILNPAVKIISMKRV